MKESVEETGGRTGEYEMRDVGGRTGKGNGRESWRI